MLRFHTLLALAITILSVVSADVPPKNRFKAVVDDEITDYTSEYGATYSFIKAKPYLETFTFPFALLFYNTTPGAYVLGLRIGVKSDEEVMRWVWDANRKNPVGENATFSLGRDGNLVLAEANGQIKWQTNTANKGVTGFKILPNGNIVLHDKKGKFVWQSFDHPTDTLLTGQSLTLNGVNKLVSRKSDEDGSDGPYSLALDKTKGLMMYVNKTGQPLAYGRFLEDNFGNKVTFDVSRESDNLTEPSTYWLVLRANPMTRVLNRINYNGTISYLRLGSDGSLKVFSFYLTWDETFSYFSNDHLVSQCDSPLLCGDYGYCHRGMCVGCPTPKGLLAWDEQCSAPKTTQFCSGSKNKTVNYYKIVGVQHFSGQFVNEGQRRTSVTDCKAECDRDCKCLGYFYKEKDMKCLTVPFLGTLIKDTNTSSIAYIKY